MVGANFMAFLAARDESPVRMSTYGVPLVRPVVPPLTRAPRACPRTDMHGAYYAAIAHSVSFLSCECVSFPLCDCRPTCLALTARSQQPRDSSATKISGCIRCPLSCDGRLVSFDAIAA